MTAALDNLPAITALYVPGDRPDRFDKARGSGADIVIIDLEDAVAPDSKAAARASAVEWIGQLDAGGPRIQVRVNSGDRDDLRAVAGLPASVELRLPSVDSVEWLAVVAEEVGERPITALVETARGIDLASAIAAHHAITSLGLGEADLASQFGSNDERLVEHLRVRVVIASLASGLDAPMMSAYTAIGDRDGLIADTVRGRRLGMVGRAAVHPSQLAAIRDVFTPSDDEVRWADEVIRVVGDGGARRLASGDMVDSAMLGRANRFLRLAAATRGVE